MGLKNLNAFQFRFHVEIWSEQCEIWIFHYQVLVVIKNGDVQFSGGRFENNILRKLFGKGLKYDLEKPILNYVYASYFSCFIF